MVMLQDTLGRLTKVLQQMPAVEDLYGLWSALRHAPLVIRWSGPELGRFGPGDGSLTTTEGRIELINLSVLACF